MKKPKKGPRAEPEATNPLSGANMAKITELAAITERLSQLVGPLGALEEAELDEQLSMDLDAAEALAEPLAFAIQRFPHAEGLPLPARGSENASGLDICAAVPQGAPVTLKPGGCALIPTGFAIEIPPSFEAQIRPRSGLALKHAVTVLNAPGTIDADYRGEIQVLLINHGEAPFTVARGDRIAQLVVGMILRAYPVEVDELEPTGRGTGGFGSTGKSEVKKTPK